MLTELLVACMLATAAAQSVGPRILGGTSAAAGQYGHTVVIRLNHMSMCGGSILNNRFVLTAGHCFYDFRLNVNYNCVTTFLVFLSRGMPASNFSIQYGTTKNSIGAMAPNVILVKKVIIHPYYQPENPRKNDLSILELQQPIVFSRWVQPVVLPGVYDRTPAGAVAVLTGWGRTSNIGRMVIDLQAVDIRVYSDEDCQRIHGTVNNENHICAGSPDEGKMQCKGDSGGPLILGKVQIGVVSWSKKPCGLPGYPGVFVKLSSYVLWIKHVIGDDTSTNHCGNPLFQEVYQKIWNFFH
ncbi:hypothetical protein Zmor_004759 [Zophobas morio]|uniref:Peptidase S1 domain-containing protein n=1 Tax=Zophobas morio TaxID=2755281 RepID=A0AA38ISB8_9CUCU|nr:hypothetical protein Zmor_004759 [Zophobas morio]